ncbi:hypothetical protein BDQ17DRAFT_1536795 [Cyathus striatus]|nr:hypothetical protein BDQ17DRAFT_1536795 [Cyathus striatus]
MAFQGAHHFNIENLYAVDNSRRREDGLKFLHNSACHGAAHYSAERGYDPPKCHPGTRRAVIDEIMTWVDSENPGRQVMWLSGPAGAGKSSIAQTIAERCHDEKKLVSSFFFSRTDTSTGRDDGNRFIPTIAYHLTTVIPEIQDLIINELEQNPAILTYSMKQQIHKLVIEPLQRVTEDLARKTPELVIVDGLDECNDRKAQVMIIQVLTWVTSQPSTRLRFLIASRPELEIRNTFDSRSVRDLCTRLVLDDHYAPSDDIAIYLRSEFDRIKDEHTLAPELSEEDAEWPSKHEIWKLVEKSSGQFIYASTIIKYIGDERRDPVERLRIIIGVQPEGDFRESPYAELDAVYTHILENAITAHDYSSISLLFMVLLYAKDTGQYNPYFPPTGGPPRIPLKPIYTFPRLSLFLGFTERLLKLLFADLHSVMNIPNAYSFAEDVHLFRFFHASFGDFLQDSARSKTFFIAKEKAHTILAKYCFTAILKSDARQLNELDDSDLSHVLLYAFHSYFYHMHQSEFDDELLHALRGQENAQELVRRMISGITTEEVEDILVRAFKFNFSALESSKFALPAMDKLDDICEYISRAVDEYVTADPAGLNSRKAIYSIIRANKFPGKLHDGEIYYCWQAALQEDSTRAKNFFLDDTKCQKVLRDLWEYSLAGRFERSEVHFTKGDAWEIMTLEYLLRKIQPSEEFKMFLSENLPELRNIIAQLTSGFDEPPNKYWNGWSRNMDQKTIDLSKDQWLESVEMLEHSIETHLKGCDPPQTTPMVAEHEEDEGVNQTPVPKPKTGFLRSLRRITKKKLKK